ncbi:MAG TPA: hypothetical protein P5244_11050 [Syntrophales bacterium]|nr:hypothetical protein [Syntrophales bacterium]
MKPHVAAAAISALKWALGLSLGFILGPILINLAGGEENTGNFVAQKLMAGIALFPILFIGIWIWGINTKKNSPSNNPAQSRGSPVSIHPNYSPPRPTNYSIPQKATSAPKTINKWNYAGIGAGIFMLLFLFVPEMLKGTLEKQYYLGGAFWIGVIILCSVNIIRAKK